MGIKHLLFVLGVTGLALGSRADQCTLTVGASDAGWYSASGFHDPNNNNYFSGYSASSGAEFRDWFAFDLPLLTAPVIDATLRVFTFEVRIPSGSATVELHHVSTPLATLTNGGTGLVNVFDDLGDGPVYATRAVAPNERNAFITFPLGSNALANISSNLGQRFAIGGRLTSFLPGNTNDHTLFGYSYGSISNVQLILTLGSTNAPVLLSQPPTNYFITVGSTLAIGVTACGALPLTYNWFFNGAQLSGQSTGTLLISGIDTNKTGDYLVVVTNSAGAVTSVVTHVTVNVQPPAISSLNYKSEITVGDAVQIEAAVSGIPFPSITWLFNGAVIAGVTNDELLILNAQLNSSGTYTLIASNAYGVVTHDITISVVPFIISGPYDRTFALGEDGSIAVSVNTTSAPVYQWRLDGTNIPGADASILPLFNPSFADAGLYDVVVMVNSFARTSSVAQVAVAESSPHLIWYPSPPVSEGNSALLEHYVSGSPPIYFQWYFKGAPLAGATNAYLGFERVSTNDAGLYFMVASNAFGVASNQIFLTILPQPVTAPGGSVARTGYAGDHILIDAGVTGGPPPAWQWVFNGTNIPGATNSSLLISNASLAQSGAYFCRGTNIYGTNTGRVDVTVQPRRALDRWTARYSLPRANDLEHIVFHNGRYVAAGQGGSILTSTNATNWIAMDLGNRYTALGLAAGNGRFAALIAEDETYFVLTSTDGLAWTPNIVPGFAYLTTISFEEGYFHVWGATASGQTQRGESVDGGAWRLQFTAGLSSPPRSIAYGAGMYIAAGYGQLFDAADGVHFTARPAGGTLNRVRYLSGIFVATGSDGTLFTSTDAGRHWRPHYCGVRGQFRGIAYGDLRFIAVCENGIVAYSLDSGASWFTGTISVQGALMTQDLGDILFDGTRFVICGHDGVLLTSTSGSIWTKQRQGGLADLKGVAYNNGVFVAVGNGALTSSNGVDWTPPQNLGGANGIIFADGRFVAVGNGGGIATSSNGFNWSGGPTAPANDLLAITFGNDTYVAVGTIGSLVTSSNAFLWTSQPIAPPHLTDLTGVAFGRGMFVTVGGYFAPDGNAVIASSSDAKTWTLANVAAPHFLRDVVFTGNEFVAVGDDGFNLYSTNGINWSGSNVAAPFQNLRHVTTVAGRVIAVGDNGTILSTRVLTNWDQHASTLSGDLYGIAFGQSKLVAVGKAGTIAQSDPVLASFSPPTFTGGKVELNVYGGMEPSYRIESSSNLLTWEGAFSLTNEGVPHSLSLNTNSSPRFFRATSVQPSP
jgi:hypothetical protein